MQKFLCLIALISCPLWANELKSSQEKDSFGVGLNYAFPFGDLGDYFKNGFAYNLSYSHALGVNSWGDYLLSSTFSHYPMKSDDIRESSKLRLYVLGIGVDQYLEKSSWFGVTGSVQPELYFWTLENNLSSSYKESDRGTLLGLRLALSFKVEFVESWTIEGLIAHHSPEFKSSLLEVGLGFGKLF